MHIEVTGHGPALVLIHGWALHSGVFAPLVEQLANHHSLYMVDLPGHGHSHTTPVPLALPHVVHAIASATPPAVWLGWSLGGLFALHAAVTLPQVRGLIMLAATPCFVRRTHWPHAVEASVFAQFAQDLQQNYTNTIHRFLALDTLGSTHGHTELRQLRKILNARPHPSTETLQTGLDLLERTDLRRAVMDLTRPSLWI
ncbi:MAG TPA: pimeloyl-ACP methyl ester esterase BioH, partial [Xylella sp.]